MNGWLVVAAVLALGLIPGGFLITKGRIGDALVGQQLVAALAVLMLLAIGLGTGHAFVLDVALAVVLLSAVGTLVFAHFLERWL